MTIVILSLASSDCTADTQSPSAAVSALSELAGAQEMLKLPVRVVDADGKPVANAKVIPWALRSSQGHGMWRKEEDPAGVGPNDVVTDADGNADVLYPKYRDVQESIGVIGVSLQVDRADFAFKSDLHVDVPLETDSPHLIQLAAGAPVKLRPLIEGSATTDEIFALWSDGRSWLPGAAPEKVDDNTLRIPTLPAGDNSVLLVKLDGDRATHFSKIVDFDVHLDDPPTLEVTIKPSTQIKGALSSNVPRPVQNGRVKAWTLAPTQGSSNRITWFTWAPVKPDGTFTLDWPADESIQVIALCDGFIATSGKAPSLVATPPDPEKDFFNRPQVFDPGDAEVEVAMTPMSRCIVKAVDEDDEPVAGVQVMAWPNVGWWNNGSQVYCHPVERGELMLRGRDYETAVNRSIPQPFQAVTDAEGKAMLELPVGEERLAVQSDVYELPVFLGRRYANVTMAVGQATETVLRLQPRGTEKLGEWDKLAGVVFGCSTREGRRICALPGVQEKMEAFTNRFREAKDQRDPQLLAEAYQAVAEAFVGVGDLAEAAKWREKATEQLAKAESSN
jgi:hypothetical protein